MGSTGSGSFTDYSKRKPADGGGTGGASGKDNCGQAFSASLEEISRCFYFMNTGTVPPAGTEVNIFFNGVRVSVETQKGEEIGYLPTKFNFIKLCMEDGFNYAGVIKGSQVVPTPSVFVDIVPL